jgi:hypothetical protein
MSDYWLYLRGVKRNSQYMSETFKKYFPNGLLIGERLYSKVKITNKTSFPIETITTVAPEITDTITLGNSEFGTLAEVRVPNIDEERDLKAFYIGLGVLTALTIFFWFIMFSNIRVFR